MDLKNLFDKRIEEFILVLTMALIVAILFTQSILRFFGGFSLSWGAELAQFLHIWQIWIGASLAIRLQSHIGVDVFVRLFPYFIQKIFRVIVIICWFVFAAFLAIAGTQYILDIMSSGQTSPSLRIPMWIPYLVIPIGGVLMIIRLIQQLYLLITDKINLNETEEIE
ncbi:TRAP transporter small permease [Salinicoccus halitifaciens]|uniref:C4-dicarboxylate transporter DctQ subunit n=1 Tax=Salinicoccus halitifaciens TaxID=1073415 RepID=A0ABV2E8J2_9STAP|nr:TRAP transporter small permease [Salinicoccus halitifaciens]MCD2137865.1 TRAP transporter small permease [Salinicoccus halitifaciens]